MKKFGFMAVLLFVFLLVFPNNGQAAAGSARIFLDGNELSLSGNAKVENVNGNIMIPFRVVGENLGFDVAWEQQTRTVTIKKDSEVIKLVVNQKTADVNGKTVSMNVAPILRTDTVLVPIRFVSEQMGIMVDWDNNKKIVYLYTPNYGNVDAGWGSGNGNETGNGEGSASVAAQVNGISFDNNQLMIAITGEPKVKDSKVSGPDRIVVDFENTSFSDTFSSSASLDQNSTGSLDISGYPDVSKVRYSLYSDNPSTVRVVIDLNYAKSYKLTNDNGLYIVDLNISDSSNPAQPGGNNDNNDGSSGKKTVVIDAGHGAKDPGTTGITGKKEKNFNLALALKVGKILKQDPNLNVVLTRSDDTFLELSERAKIANDLKADVFVAIHANSAGSSAASGSETYYQRDASKALANVMHKHLVQAAGLPNRGVKYGNFHVIRETKMPAVLLEVGYLSNKNDEASLFSESFQQRVAQGVADGIKEYLGVK
ncbi:N-acetylmuramoyl-L-alanine amidase family protein [Paenibacillus sp.]|jgi:N-acetylmuramoyl-L-alanine amidase|uniref:N-acetylmuramoyl-L-alanine amidase family protein n=1 Tax=Paenibacillus sp. TaxID=58172 RepID=UPI00282B544D|nr:N-acetylmuramoyl-L-alanine amidase family protein [Paenibacillus sp.]MDR0270680.1 N-acetylmuramoyl-L-alanine amidase family protein [Paenibacillus sp.]